MTTLQQIYMNQLQKEVVINENFVATSIAAIFGWQGNAGGLDFNYYGGRFKTQDGIVDEVQDGSITLDDNTTNFIYFNFETGFVEYNTTAVPQNSYSIAEVVTLNGNITEYTDLRFITLPPRGGIDVPVIVTIETPETFNTTTLTNTSLSADVEAEALYHIETHIIYICNVQNNDIKVGFTSPTDSVGLLTIEVSNNKLLLPHGTIFESGSLAGGGVGVANEVRTAKIKGHLKTGATAGTFDILAAVASGSDTITIENALLFIVKVA